MSQFRLTNWQGIERHAEDLKSVQAVYERYLLHLSQAQTHHSVELEAG